MNFKYWLDIVESTTTADAMSEYDSATTKLYKSRIQPLLTQIPKISVPSVLNFFTYLYLSEEVSLDQITKQFNRDWGKYGAMILSKIAQNKNFFNVALGRTDLEHLNIAYHRELSLSGNKRKGPEGEPIVDVGENLKTLSVRNKIYNPSTWMGWKWVSLGCRHSPAEAAAAGHCGNSGGYGGDNIVSLRDPQNNVHLTFIVNTKTGALGEAKGINNQKPGRQYHPAIVALLLSGYVDARRKRNGYQPENDFVLDDLDKEIRSIIEQHFDQQKQHKVPSNYLSADWLYRITQQDIDVLTLPQKVQLLPKIINILDNHQLLDSRDEEGNRIDDEIKPLNFNLSSLIMDIVSHLPPTKETLGVINKINSLRWTSRDKGNFDINKPEVEKVLYEKAIELTQTNSIHDKLTLLHILNDLGYEQANVEGTKYDYAEWNKYQKDVNRLSDDIMNMMIQKKNISDTEFFIDYIHNTVQQKDMITTPEEALAAYKPFSVNNYIYSKIQFQLSRDKKVVLSRLTEKFDLETYWKSMHHKVTKWINEIYDKMLPELTKRGFSQYLNVVGSSRSISLVAKIVIDKLDQAVRARYMQQVKNAIAKYFHMKVTTREDKYFYRTAASVSNIVQDPYELVKEIRETRRCKLWDDLIELSEHVVRQSYEDLLQPKVIEQIMKEHVKEIIDIVAQQKEPGHYDAKAGKWKTRQISNLGRHYRGYSKGHKFTNYY